MWRPSGTACALIEAEETRFTRSRISPISHCPEDRTMLWTIALVLFVLWILGFGVFHIAGGLIHILLVLAVISILWNLIAGRRAV
jgi:Family of unknown function (DUF5670)